MAGVGQQQQGGMGMQGRYGMNRGGPRPFGQQPQSVGASGIPPWASQSVSSAPMGSPLTPGIPNGMPPPSVPRGVPSGSGAPFTNFRFNPDGTSASGSADPNMPRTGGVNYYNAPNIQPMDPSMAKPMQVPQTGGQDYFNAPNPSTFMQQSTMPPPQSWEQQNAQLLRPQQMQDPAMATQTPWGSPTAQTLFPGLTPQQLAQVNRIGSNPGGGGAALNDYLLSFRYPGALYPGQSTTR